ncbi:DUF1421 domain-containing protein, partial [Cephalotus follicularis]
MASRNRLEDDDDFGGDFSGNSRPPGSGSGNKRSFGELEDDDDDIFGSKKANSKVGETGMILKLRESLQDCNDTLATCQSELEAAKTEIQRWHSSFQNEYFIPAGTTPEPKFVINYLQTLKSSDESLREQLEKAKKKEAAFIVTFAKREQEIAELKSAIRDLRAQLKPPSMQTRRLLLDPAIHEEFTRLKNLVEEKDKKVKELQDNIAGVTFTGQSKMGKMLIAKCKTLQEENEEIGQQASEGKIHELSMKLSLQKSQNAELRSQFEGLYKHMEGLTNDVEKSNEMVLILQEQLEEKHRELERLKQELHQKSLAEENKNDSASNRKEKEELYPPHQRGAGFNKESLTVKDLEPSFALAALNNGLRSNSRFTFSLLKKPAKDMAELLKRAERYVNAEEEMGDHHSQGLNLQGRRNPSSTFYSSHLVRFVLYTPPILFMGPTSLYHPHSLSLMFFMFNVSLCDLCLLCIFVQIFGPVGPSYGAALIADIDRKMKQHADNLMHAVEGLSARVTQLETRVRQLENAVYDLKDPIEFNHGRTDGKLWELENGLIEVQGVIQDIRDTQEIAEAKLQLEKLMLSKCNQQMGKQNKSISAQDALPSAPQQNRSISPPQIADIPFKVPPYQPHQYPPLTPAATAPQLPSQIPKNIFPSAPQPEYYYNPPGLSPENICQQYHLALNQQPQPPFTPALHELHQPSLQHPPVSQVSQLPQMQPPFNFPSGHSHLPQHSDSDNPYTYGSSFRYSSSNIKSSQDSMYYSAPGSGSAHSRLPTAKILPHALPTASSVDARTNYSADGKGVPVDDVVDKIVAMGFRRDLVRATARKLSENEQSVDLNVVLDKLMNTK